jgi:hypothetical protein
MSGSTRRASTRDEFEPYLRDLLHRAEGTRCDVVPQCPRASTHLDSSTLP